MRGVSALTQGMSTSDQKVLGLEKKKKEREIAHKRKTSWIKESNFF